ncbi:MAG: long-chain fatty acid--CoA ligase [Polyangia bacterium]
MTERATIIGLFAERVAEAPRRPALMERSGERWAEHSWSDWNERSRAIAAALIDAGVKPGDSVAIHSYSRRQWVEVDIAILMCKARTVTIYHNLRAESVRYILDDCGARIVFAEGPVQLEALFSAQGSEPAGSVRRVIHTLERQTPPARPGEPPPRELGIEDAVPAERRELLVSLEDFVARGREALEEHGEELERRIAAVEPGDTAKVVYTSGTTGEPKGAMLTHRNLTSVVERIGEDIGIRSDDLCLLFLPLAHVYAQLTYHAALCCGFTLAFARSMLTAVDDAESVRPHFFTTVPRLFEKIHAGMLAQIEQASPVRRGIFGWAEKVGRRVSREKQLGRGPSGLLAWQYALADRLVFSKLKQRLGGRIRFAVSGGAPLQRHLLEFFHAAGLLIIEGYGMTENASLSHRNTPEAYRFGTVGTALSNVEVEIAADGEILLRGPNVMDGYLGRPEETAEAIDGQGWLHTGDIGFIDENGFLTITDRKKDIIITAGGKNIAPAPIEAALTRGQLISQAVVFGDQRKFLVALLTLDAERAEQWARENGVGARGEELCEDERLR